MTNEEILKKGKELYPNDTVIDVVRLGAFCEGVEYGIEETIKKCKKVFCLHNCEYIKEGCTCQYIERLENNIRNI